MPDSVETSPLSEPVIIDCQLVEGTAIVALGEMIHIVGFVLIELTDVAMPERRIVTRIALPTTAARALSRDLRRSLARGGH